MPVQPPPEPTEDDPEPFRFTPTDEVLAYTPAGHPSGGDAARWRSLSDASRFPHVEYHHIMSVAHEGRIWSIGGHAGDFDPQDTVYVFTPDGMDTADGSWSAVLTSDGAPCDPAADECLKLPKARAAGAAVSMRVPAPVASGSSAAGAARALQCGDRRRPHLGVPRP